jgi:hypothetical protein
VLEARLDKALIVGASDTIPQNALVLGVLVLLGLITAGCGPP